MEFLLYTALLFNCAIILLLAIAEFYCSLPLTIYGENQVQRILDSIPIQYSILQIIMSLIVPILGSALTLNRLYLLIIKHRGNLIYYAEELVNQYHTRNK